MLTIVLGFILLVLTAAAYVVHGVMEKRKNNRRASTRKKELDAFYTSPLKVLEKVDVACNEGEVFYYAGYAEWEERAGAAKPQAMSRQPGMLYLSNQRLTFVRALGPEEQMAFGAWQDFAIRPSEIELRFRESATVVIHSEDMMLGPIFGRLTKKQFAPLHS